MNQKNRATPKPGRTETHRIDTKAVRRVISELHVDWVIRSLEERDYGIDLQIEFFEGDNPTGNTAYVQVKGTSTDEKMEKFSFPVKTLLYAEDFIAPFFLFYVSTTGTIKFVWLQKYIEMQLHVDSPDWRTQDEVTIYFPDENSLGTVGGKEKFIRIVKIQSQQPIALKFLKVNSNLQRFAPETLAADTAGREQIRFCAAEAKKLSDLTGFLLEKGELRLDGLQPTYTVTELKEISRNLHTIFTSDYLQDEEAFISNPKDQKIVNESLFSLRDIENSYLNESSLHAVMAKIGGKKLPNLKKPY
jgi:hypothetical protein